MSNHANLHDLHYEHQLWSNELAFVKQEIGIFEKRLGTLVMNNTDNAFRAQAEHFQNQFIRHNEVIDETLHNIQQHEAALAKYAQDKPVAVDRVHFEDHTNLREAFETFRKRYAEIKAEYQKFSGRYL